jgi:hypothetical protein
VTSRRTQFSQRCSEYSQLKMMTNYGENFLPNPEIFKYVRIKADGHSHTQQPIKLAALPSQALCKCLMYTTVCILRDGRYISVRVRVHVTLFFSIQNLRNAVLYNTQ